MQPLRREQTLGVGVLRIQRDAGLFCGHRLELRTARVAGKDQVGSVLSELLAKVPVLEGEHAVLGMIAPTP